MLLRERVLLADGAALSIEFSAEEFVLQWQRGAKRVLYEGRRGRYRRSVLGRMRVYEFRSVEQMRYDFERDVEAVGGSL